MFPATSARHLSIVRPRMAKPPTRMRGLRGDSFVRSFPITFVFIIHANGNEGCRNPRRNFFMDAKRRCDAKQFYYGTTKRSYFYDQRVDRDIERWREGVQGSRRRRERSAAQVAVSGIFATASPLCDRTADPGPKSG